MSLLISTVSHAGTNDVIPKNGLAKGERYVRVTSVGNDSVKFEKCISGYEKTSCSLLGGKASYTLKELRKQKYIESAQVAGAVFADIEISGAAVVAGFYALSAIPAIANMSGIGLLFASTIVGAPGAITSVVIASVDALNPVEQTNQALTVTDDVITDQTVHSENIDRFIERLDLVLSKL